MTRSLTRTSGFITVCQHVEALTAQPPKLAQPPTFAPVGTPNFFIFFSKCLENSKNSHDYYNRVVDHEYRVTLFCSVVIPYAAVAPAPYVLLFS
jgi:hypothetical protein